MDYWSLFGWAGMIVLLLAYVLITTQVVFGTSYWFQGLSLIGAACFITHTYQRSDWPIFWFNVIWSSIALGKILSVKFFPAGFTIKGFGYQNMIDALQRTPWHQGSEGKYFCGFRIGDSSQNLLDRPHGTLLTRLYRIRITDLENDRTFEVIGYGSRSWIRSLRKISWPAEKIEIDGNPLSRQRSDRTDGKVDRHYQIDVSLVG